jgi:hypothetical protein
MFFPSFYFQQTVVYFVLAIVFTVASSLLIEVHSEIGGQRMALILQQIASSSSTSLAAAIAADGGNGDGDDSSGDGGDNDDEDEIIVSFWTKYNVLIAAVSISYDSL